MSDVTQQPLYLIKYDDHEVPDEVIFGADAANKRFEQISTNWNAHLFVKVASNSRDDRWSASNAKLATDFDAEHALKLEAERQVGELREQRDSLSNKILRLQEFDRLREDLLTQVKGERDRMICRTVELSPQLDKALELLRAVVELDPRVEFMGWELDGKIDAFLNTTSTEGKDHE